MNANTIHIELVEKRVGDSLPMKTEDGAFVTIMENNVVKNFHDWEMEKMKPFLEKHGFTVLSFENGEKDSFGPLSRVAITRHNETNKLINIWYG